MNKNLQIFLIVLLFCASSAGGYVVCEIVNPNRPSNVEKGRGPSIAQATEVCAEEELAQESLHVESSAEDNANELEAVVTPAKSTVPDKPTITRRPQYDNGTYSFTVESRVESGDPLKYELYDNSQCTGTAILESTDGNFKKVAYASGGKYYVRAVNCNMQDEVSEAVEVSRVHYRHKPLTKEEIQNAFNSREELNGNFKNRLGTPDVTVINAKLDRDKNIQVAEIRDKFNMGTWKSITVKDLTHNQSYGTVSSLKIEVEYSE